MYSKGKFGDGSRRYETQAQTDRRERKLAKRAQTTPEERAQTRRAAQRRVEAAVKRQRAKHTPRSSWWKLPGHMRQAMRYATSQASHRGHKMKRSR
jgi:acyl-CoA reductase-like NAD-dependent aldehyde dehydrogenase